MALAAPLRWGVSRVRVRIRRPKSGEIRLRPRALVIGHRGFSAIAPENTLPAFDLALAAGVDLVELDFRQSADGQLVVVHDRYLDRTTDARLRWGGRRIEVEAKTAREICALEAGTWFGSGYRGARIPLLSEALELIQRRGIALLERKSGEVETTARLLEKAAAPGRIIVQSFDWSFLSALHARLPHLLLAALGPLAGLRRAGKAPGVFGQLGPRWLKALEKTGAGVVVWNKQVSRAAVRQAHDQGLKVWVYTIDRPQLANRLLDAGVDGLITNNPALLWKTMALR